MRTYRGPERRRYMRLETDCEIRYIKLSADLKPISSTVSRCHSKDVSALGVKLITTEKLAIGSLLEIHLKLPTAHGFLTAMGKVVRCYSEKRHFVIALSFIWINKKDKKRLTVYIKNKKLEKLRYQIKK